VYPEVLNNKDFILSNLSQEEEKFEKTLENSLKKVNKWFYNQDTGYKAEYNENNIIVIYKTMSGLEAFNLVTTEGLPIELLIDIANENGFRIDIDGFNDEFKKHKELSQTSSAGMFKGGLADAGEETKQLHTATHLLRQALEIVLGENIVQKGSNINSERLRFDFAFPRKLTDEEKKKVEDLVNEKIKEALPMTRIELPKDEALATGAVHNFGDKYGDIVSVYYIGNSLDSAFSKEFCGGPHVSSTNELGVFKIAKEEAVSAGVRRIKAILV
jgi:alanyl-tRNA synthetase